jgi:hypothetical protein
MSLPFASGRPARRAAAAVAWLLVLSAPITAGAGPHPDNGKGGDHTRVLWLDHFGLLPGDSDLTTSHRSTTSCPGFTSCLTGLVVESSTTGDHFAAGGNKVVHMAAGVPPGFDVTGVRVCYELSNPASFITQVRLAQVQDPPDSALVLLDDVTDLTEAGPACVDTEPPFAGSIDPEAGSLLVSLRLNYSSTTDRIVVRGLGLLLQKSGGH